MEIFLPKKFQESFKVRGVEEKSEEWRVQAVEREGQIPIPLEGREYVLDGYKNSVEIIDFPFRGKPVYITFTRRRWKDKESGERYTNDYIFHRPGMKTTDEFGDFLKGLTGSERREYFCAFKDLRYISEEDF